jgi:hypothetical protein
MPNTVQGLPYPAATDPVAAGAAAIQALAAATTMRRSCRAKIVAGQAMSGVAVVVNFDGEDWDTHAIHDPAAPSRLTIPAGLAGLWLLTAAVTLGGAGNAWTGIWLRKNGAAALVESADTRPSNVAGIAGLSFVDLAVVGDYYEIVAKSGVAGNYGPSTFAASFVSA